MAFYRLTIPDGPFKCLVADPPWPFKDRLPGKGRGAAKHYETMSLEEIERMRRPLLGGTFCLDCGYGGPDEGRDGTLTEGCEGSGLESIPSTVADNAHLYLWTPNAFVRDAWGIAEAWGFEPKTLMTWVKVTKASQSFQSHTTIPLQIRMGMGHGFRGCTEHVVVATRGKLDFLSKAMPNVFFAPRQTHSQKPDIFYDIVESMSPGPRLELFAGRERTDWTTLIDTEGEPNGSAR